MTTSSRTRRGKKQGKHFRLLAIVALLAAIREGRAQEVVMPPPQPASTPEAILEQENSNPMNVFSKGPYLVDYTPFRIGWMGILPHISYDYIYATGLLSSPGVANDTSIQDFSPGVTFMLGKRWTLDYTPTWTTYSNTNFSNSLNHSVDLQGTATGLGWTARFSQTFEHSDSVLYDTGTQTDQDTFVTSGQGVYAINDKMSWDLNLNQTFQSTGQYSNIRSWGTMDWFNYTVSQRFNLGVGAGVTYYSVDYGNDQLMETPQGRMGWRLTDKLSFSVNAGVNASQPDDFKANDLSPVYGATVQYEPTSTTHIYLTASRSSTVSYFNNQNLDHTSLDAQFQQRLLKHLLLALDAGYAEGNYIDTLDNLYILQRKDKTYSFGVTLSTTFLKRGRASIFYRYIKNDSNGTISSGPITGSADKLFSFTSSQYGVQVSYAF